MTGPVTTEALVAALADYWRIARRWPLSIASDIARDLVAGPLAPLLAALQQVTAERDEAREVVARCNNSFGSYSYHLNPHPAEQIEKVKWQARSEWQRAEAAEASLATATSELARLRGDVELLSRAIDMAKAEVAFAQQDEVDGSSAASRRVRFRGILDALNGVGDPKARTALARAATAREGA